MSTATAVRTANATFYHLPNLDRDVFTVQAGLPAEQAIVTARCILESLRGMAKTGVQEGINEAQCFGMSMLIEMVDGLMASLEERL